MFTLINLPLSRKSHVLPTWLFYNCDQLEWDGIGSELGKSLDENDFQDESLWLQELGIFPPIQDSICFLNRCT
jgi:hypothetical protein